MPPQSRQHIVCSRSLTYADAKEMVNAVERRAVHYLITITAGCPAVIQTANRRRRWDDLSLARGISAGRI